MRWKPQNKLRRKQRFLLTGAWVALVFLRCGLNAAPSPTWETGDGFRFRPLTIPSEGHAGFAMVPPNSSGVLFSNVLSDAALEADSSLLSGSGVALGDIDGDGWCDFYLCSLSGTNALYRNLGNWRFEEMAGNAGVRCPGQLSRGATFADVDGDRDLDLLVTARGNGTRLFLNDGKGSFTETTAAAGLASKTGSTSMALADVNGDGALDLYVANFGVGSVLRDGGKITTRIVNGRPVVVGRMAKRVRIIDGKLVEFGEPDSLYLNTGNGRFNAVSWDKFLDETGNPMEAPWDFGLAVQMRDLNGDHWPDIYVCNDFFTPDRVWLNDGKGGFRALPELAIRKSSNAAMGVDFADFDRDGFVDAFVVEMMARNLGLRLRQMTPDSINPPIVGASLRRPQVGRNTLLWNRGDGTFAEIAEFAGVAASDWSWMPVFLDVDLDGFEDLLVPNGHPYDMLDLDTIERGKLGDPRSAGFSALSFPRIESPNCAFRNNPDRTFTECGASWGFDSRNISNGMALADLDGDGDLDLVVNCLNAPALLYRNESVAPRLAVRLKGTRPNTQGIGATVTVNAGGLPKQWQEIVCAGRYLSGDDPVRVFAAGTQAAPLTIEVAWRNGNRSVVTNALPNRLYELEEPREPPTPSAAPSPKSSPLFTDISSSLGHSHHEEPFDDLQVQPLLPRRLSQLGPGVAWVDLDKDGTDELVIGAGRNGRLTAYKWNGKDGFTSLAIESPTPLAGDSAGLAAFTAGGASRLLVGVSNYETQGTNVAPLLSLSHSTQGLALTPAVDISGWPAAAGPLAAADLDGDGNLEVFLGGRTVPGHYPRSAPSLLLRVQDGKLVVDTNLSVALREAGLVSGAVFSDLTGDGHPELVLACEWGTLRVFQFTSDSLIEKTAALGLGAHRGWWQSVTAADLDSDGRMDLVAGNWGLNSGYHVDERTPARLLFGDFNGDGTTGIFEVVYDVKRNKWLSRRNWRVVCEALPFILERIGSHRAFSEAGAEQVLGDRFRLASVREATTLASAVFLNRGGRFEQVPLPDEAQVAPVFGIGAADFDGDGAEDLVLAQNFFAMPSEAARLDAGRGLLLKGNGDGRFSALPGHLSGLMVYGEQRGCAVTDFDRDGRTDLAIAQNGEATRVFRNAGAAPGALIRLRGPEGNPLAAGAMLRVGKDGKFGAAREIHLGSGYWSQDSVTQIMATRASASHVWVRWPGGRTTTLELPDGTAEVRISIDGQLERVK